MASDLAVEANDGRLTAFRIALVYVVLGGAWILFTDQLLAVLPLDGATVTHLQTGKGWVFVGVSGLLIYLLVARSRRELAAANERLRKTLVQSSVVHRVLRHNIRNLATVVELNSRALADRVDEEECEERATIHRSVERLTELGTKARELRDLALAGEGDRKRLDLVAVVRQEVETLRETHPSITITSDLPETATVTAHPRLPLAISELLENAAVHANGVTISVALSQLGDEVRLDVGDNGPGMPEMERDVLEHGTEQPLQHSQGVGLWLVRVIVTESGGSIRVVDNEPEGTVVVLTLAAADADRRHG